MLTTDGSSKARVAILWTLCIVSASALRATIHQRKHLGSGSTSLSTQELSKELLQRRQASRVWMSPQEIALIESYLTSSDTMLEWGSGYSTLWYSQFVKDYYSIEHDQAWSEQMQSQLEFIKKVNYLNSPVEKGFRGWLGGFDEGTYAQFEKYVKAVDSFKADARPRIIQEPGKPNIRRLKRAAIFYALVPIFDKVLIDGRARAICAEYVLKYLHPKSLVFIHDYTPRGTYHDAAKMLYTKVAEVVEDQSVIVLRPKPDALARAKSGDTIITNFDQTLF